MIANAVLMMPRHLPAASRPIADSAPCAVGRTQVCRADDDAYARMRPARRILASPADIAFFTYYVDMGWNWRYPVNGIRAERGRDDPLHQVNERLFFSDFRPRSLRRLILFP